MEACAAEKGEARTGHDGVTVDAAARARAATEVGAILTRLYGEIGERSMRGLPIHNPRLRVEAVGFHDDGGRIVGIMATPWFMNLVIAASPFGPGLPEASLGASVAHALAGGVFDCVVGGLDGFGRLDSVSLFSPMFDFDDPEVVRAAAEAAMEEIRRVPETAPAEERPTAPTLDRRALLFGRRGGEEGATCR